MTLVTFKHTNDILRIYQECIYAKSISSKTIGNLEKKEEPRIMQLKDENNGLYFLKEAVRFKVDT